MTLDERFDTINKAFTLLNAGDREGYSCLIRTIPMPTYLAKVAKETMGVDFLTKGGWNLTEVEAEFGRDWLNK